jgi:luciferase family oxidoreductase group 1
MTKLSVLDLVPVREGGTLPEAYEAATDLARCAEANGYKRFWVAEHHAMEGIAGGAASVVLAHIGNATSTIRIGSGGIMLPNHNPFVIAEQFGTLEALFGPRIDLGLGRAPGADGRIQQAFRKNLHQAAEHFPQDVLELRALITGEPALPLKATPGLGATIEFWMLGSSLFGAQLAAKLGMPYAFAAHFAPDHLDAALELYRRDFEPSEQCEKPHVMVAMNIFAADSDDAAQLMASSQQQSFVRLRSGEPGKLPPPIANYSGTLPAPSRAMLDHLGQAAAVGNAANVKVQIAAFIERTNADEIIACGSTYDPDERLRSLELTAQVMDDFNRVPAGSSISDKPAIEA